MSVKCFEPEELGQILALPEKDPRARHLRECPRCRSLVRAYREFAAPTEGVPAGADLVAARATLMEKVEAEIHARRPRPTTSRGENPMMSLWRKLTSQPALAGAVVVLVVIGTLWFARPTDNGTAPVLRGREDPAVKNFGTLEARRAADGARILSWQTVPEADSYEVTFFTAGLEEIGHESVAGPSLTLTRERMEAWAAGGDVILWRVTALRGGDPVGSSPVSTLALP